MKTLRYHVQADEAERLMEIRRMLFQPGHKLTLVLGDGSTIEAVCTEQVQNDTFVYTTDAFIVEAVTLSEEPAP